MKRKGANYRFSKNKNKHHAAATGHEIQIQEVNDVTHPKFDRYAFT